MAAIVCGAHSVGSEPLFTPASPLAPNSYNIIASSGQGYTMFLVPQSFPGQVSLAKLWNTWQRWDSPYLPVHVDAPLNFACPLFFFYTAIYLSHGPDIFIFTASSTLLRGFMSTDFNLPSLPSFFLIPSGELTSHFAKYPHFKGFYAEGQIPSS